MNPYELLAKCTGFDWDDDNATKIFADHDVSPTECEEVFFNQPLTVATDTKHSKHEIRYYSLGHTDAGRLLFVAFTLRRSLIRPISARDMNQRERRLYKQL
jgi:uncharacterized DUF497 family protein